ncbi:UNVERIFIED_CONTAM: hypothetical protein Slati_1377700 [Sesamum latifolium]|uniref:DUF4283 domain-containing protein n=1 Tax=Sesamum latifolium TaxID=2727402 RepID=A0AAW2XJN8_9LAMI
MVHAVWRKWETTAMGYFLGLKPPFHQVQAYFRSIWPDVRDVIATVNGFFFITFKMLGAMDDAIDGGPWLFQGHPLVLQRWQPAMALRKHSHTQVPVWIKLRHLPVELWTEDRLSTVASGVEYEWIPAKCVKCSALGHSTANCPATKRPSKPPVKVFVEKPTENPPSRPPCQPRVQVQEVVHDASTLRVEPLEECKGGHDFHTDCQANDKGPGNRIWLAWDASEAMVDVLFVHAQCIHCRILNLRSRVDSLVTVAYGLNDAISHRELWSQLVAAMENVGDEPWIVLGDFNAVLDHSEVCGHSGASYGRLSYFSDRYRAYTTALPRGVLYMA